MSIQKHSSLNTAIDQAKMECDNSQPSKGAFSGTVVVRVKPGMKVQIKPSEIEGQIHLGREFVVDGEPRNLCGTEVVTLKNLDGSRFSPAYDLSMLEVTDLMDN